MEENLKRIAREYSLVRALVLRHLEMTESGIRSAGETLEVDGDGGYFAWGFEGNEGSLWGTVQEDPIEGWVVAFDPDCIVA